MGTVDDEGVEDTGVEDTPAICDSSEPVLDQGGSPTGYGRCVDGPVHRTAAVACDVDPDLPGDCNASDDEPGCSIDADCSQPGEKCMEVQSEPVGCSCQAVVECQSDADCDSDQVCFCNGLRSACISASCQLDADCGEGAVCALSEQRDACSIRSRRLDCIDAEQPCLSDDDCSEAEDACQPDQDGAWICTFAGVGPCG